MDRPAAGNIAGFSDAELFADLESGSAARLIAAAADLALIVDSEGVVRDISYSASDPSPEGMREWIGRPWSELVTIESRAKVESLLRDATPGGPTRGREVNHAASGDGGDLPIRFSTIRIDGDGHVLALGRDLRSVAGLQQKLVDAQLMLDREYGRMRNIETRYRLLFQLSTEAILIVDDATEKVVELNAAASTLIDEPTQRLLGKSLAELFDSQSALNVRKLVSTARTLGNADPVRVRLVDGSAELFLSASAFRQDNATHLLIRMTDASRDGFGPSTRSRALEAIMKLPDGFVVVDGQQRILEANDAFVSMVELAAPERVKGSRLDAWLGRPGIDAGLLISNLREHGSLRDFATIVRGEFGAVEQVEVTGVAVVESDDACFGLMIRSTRRLALRTLKTNEAFRSVEQLTELVGRVSLKELVRESTDMIEKLCIEAALKRTDDNRVSAAQILGLSRQSLYSKLHRHGLVREGDDIGED